MSRLKEAMRASAAEVNAALDGYIPRSSDSDGPLFDAMRYSILAGGKRLRPFLVLNSAALFKVPPEWAMPSAAAIEMVHTYSLVHDDLPAMDDDDLRRGQPTCHKKFDEATAILAGDSLLTLAFELAAAPDGHPDPAVRAEIVHSLAIAAGGVGMAGGQMMDLAAAEGDLDLAAVTRLQVRKTGALFRFSCTAGAIWPSAKGRNARRSGVTPTISAWPFKSPTIFSTSRARKAISARRWARTPPPARRLSSTFSGASKRACAPRNWPRTQ